MYYVNRSHNIWIILQGNGVMIGFPMVFI